jgi:hypothetical protein
MSAVGGVELERRSLDRAGVAVVSAVNPAYCAPRSMPRKVIARSSCGRALSGWSTTPGGIPGESGHASPFVLVDPLVADEDALSAAETSSCGQLMRCTTTQWLIAAVKSEISGSGSPTDRSSRPSPVAVRATSMPLPLALARISVAVAGWSSLVLAGTDRGQAPERLWREPTALRGTFKGLAFACQGFSPVWIN